MQNAVDVIQLDSARFILSANESQPQGISGMFIHVRSATGEFQVKTNNGDRVPMQAGDKVAFPKPFNSIVVKDLSGAGNTIEIVYGAGGDYKSDSVTGSVTISGTVAVTDNGGSLTVDDGGKAFSADVLSTSKYFRNSATASLFTIVTPAANVGGIKITALSLRASSDLHRVMAHTSAPSAWYDGVCIATHAYTQSRSLIGLPIIIPAGYGLYEQASSSSSNTLVDIAYEVL